ncbi:MAG: hypothetical protein A2W30_05660 [Ignavibacteria bacterium RBG_16_36_9]|nr:MAG: hypothetical protein A2W30_05660 [Ignavibacteria bacterium RBG_16_36_9]
MNILVVAADLVPNYLGGAELHLVEVVKRLERYHHFSIFVGENTKIKKLFSNSVTIIPVNYPRITNFMGISYITIGFISIFRYIKRKRFDLIWAKQSYPQAPLAALLSKLFHLPLYITAQNPKLLSEELVIRGSMLKPFQNLFALLLEPLIRWSYRQASLVAAVSGYSCELAKEFGAKKVIVIPNGIDLNRFIKPKKVLKKQNIFTIVSTSALIPRNSMDTLIESAALLPDNKKWKVLIAGEGPEKDKLQMLIDENHLQNRVELVGRIKNENIATLLSSSDLFVRPSRKEGFGVSFIEAMASGVPVIATPVGGITDFIEHEQTGLMVTPNDAKGLSQAINRMMNEIKLYHTIQKNALKLVQKKYSWDHIADEVHKVFQTIT